MISTVTPRDCGRMTKRALQFQAKHVAANYEYLTSGCGRASTVTGGSGSVSKDRLYSESIHAPLDAGGVCIFLHYQY